MKPVNRIGSDDKIIKAHDLDSPIKINVEDVDGVVSLEDNVDYFIIYKDPKHIHHIDNFHFEGDSIVFTLPPLRPGVYHIEIKDYDGRIYPADDDIEIHVKTSFENKKEVYYQTYKGEIINEMNEITLTYIDDNIERFKGPKGDPGPEGPPGKEGIRGPRGKDGNVDFDTLTDKQLEILKPNLELDDSGNLYIIK